MEEKECISTIMQRYKHLAKGVCPRCGKKEDMKKSALSRRVYINVCARCGEEEALYDYIHAYIVKDKEPEDLNKWYIVQNEVRG